MGGGIGDLWSGVAGLDPWAALLVAAGSLLVATVRTGWRVLRTAFAALDPLCRADPVADAELAARITRRVEAIAEAKALTCVDRIAPSGRFLGEAIRRLSDARTGDDFARWAEESLAARRVRHGRVHAFWTALADAAPAMGMIATVLGLVRMFGHLDDPRLIGPPMAAALVATLAGLVLAHVVAGPVAARLERLSADELAWQARTLAHFTALARAELDHAPGLQRRLRERLA